MRMYIVPPQVNSGSVEIRRIQRRASTPQTRPPADSGEHELRAAESVGDRVHDLLTVELTRAGDSER